jgi:hypothetical protein
MIFLVWLGLGRLTIYALQANGLTRSIFDRYAKLKELVDCDFCLGFWIFSLLAWAFGINLLAPVYIPVLSEAASGLIASFFVHIARIGWTTKFGVVDLRSYED